MEQQTLENERSDRISRLLKSHKSRASYIKSKLAVLVPAQIKALRLKSTNPTMPKQSDLGRESGMHQSRISMFETPGAANITLDTLSKIAAGLRCGLIVEFVPFSEMLRRENSFSPDTFRVTRLEDDAEFVNPGTAASSQYLGNQIMSEVGVQVAPQPIPLAGFAGAAVGEGIRLANPSIQSSTTQMRSRRPKGKKLPRPYSAVRRSSQLTG